LETIIPAWKTKQETNYRVFTAWQPHGCHIVPCSSRLCLRELIH
jgi:hypothetical protein